MATYRNSDLIMAAGSGYGGGCYCPKDSGDGGDGGDLLGGNLGLAAAAAAAFFLLYTTATMLARRKREAERGYSEVLDMVFKGIVLLMGGI